MPKLKKDTHYPSDEEEKIIQQHAKDDDTELTGEQLKKMSSAEDLPRLSGLTKRGRPKKVNPKVQTTLRLDPEVADFFRSKGRGWQTEINKVLKKHVEAKQRVSR